MGVRVGKFIKIKTAGKDNVTGEMAKGRGEIVIDWIWKLCNIPFEKVWCLRTGDLL